MVKDFIAIGFAVLMGVGVSIVGAASVELTDHGVATSVIVLHQDTIEPEKTAARELQTYLEKITGATIAIQAESKASGKSRIFIGQSDKVRKRLPNFDWDTLKTDGIVIKSVGNDLIIAGDRPRGTLYAVYSFLQDTLGCRWYASDMAEVIPHWPTLALDAIDVVYTPPFELRQIHGSAFADPIFALKNRQNGREWMAAAPAEYGKSASFGKGHTLRRQFLDPQKHFEKHPEWYAYRKKTGKRIQDGQICFTNRAARKECVREVLAYLKSHPGIKMISLSPDDNDRYCECEKCQAFIQGQDTGLTYMDGIRAGRTGVALDFVNAVARQVEKEYPDVLINFLAYWHTNFPPKTVKPHRNVMIHCAVMMRSYCESVAETSSYVDTLKFWRKYSPKVYIWDYLTNFANYIRPFPCYFCFGDSLRFYQSINIDGVFAQAAWGKTADFVRPMAWVNAQLLWNPNQDEKALMREFLNAYYGKAGPVLMEYMLFMRKTARDAKVHIGCYDKTTAKWLSLDDLTRATRLFNRAVEAVADDPDKLYRVRREKLGLDLVWLERYEDLKAEAEKKGIEFLGPKDPRKEYQRIAANEFKETTYRESGGFSKYMKILKEKFQE